MTPRLLILITSLCAVLALPAAAQASPTQTMTFEAPRELVRQPELRTDALDEIGSFGVRSLRVILYWQDVAPQAASATKPAFDETDPAAYDWGQYEALMDAVQKRGWSVLMTVSGPVPKWATAGKRDNLTRPSARRFERFVTAAARQFGGRVERWSVWNEPNQPQFLLPQFSKAKRPLSPRIYRGLFLAAQRGLRAGGEGAAPLLIAETSPRGTGKVVAPLTFLRGMLCLDGRYRKSARCGRLTPAGYAHHAYTPRAGPAFVPPGKNDVTIGVLGRLVRALDRAAQARALPGGLPISLTEFGIQSKPDPIIGVSFMQQAEFRAISERIAYENPRVAAFSQYLLRDDPPREGLPRIARYGGFESGLRASNGDAKPALDAFRVPLAVRRSRTRVSLWGLVRPAGGATQALLQYSDGAGYRDLMPVTTDAAGYFRVTSQYVAGRRWRLLWTSPEGRELVGPPTRAYNGR